MSAVLGVFCPKSQRPLNDFENELVKVSEGLNSVDVIARALGNSQEYQSISVHSALEILNSQAKKVEEVMKDISEELVKVKQKSCFGIAVDSKRFYTILLSGGDSLLVIAGIVLVATGDTKGKVAGGALTAIGQGFSKVNDVISNRRGQELIRKDLLGKYLVSAETMKSSINFLKSSLELYVTRNEREPMSLGSDVVDGQEDVSSLASRTSRANVALQALKDGLVEYQKKRGFRHERGPLSSHSAVDHTALLSESV